MTSRPMMGPITGPYCLGNRLKLVPNSNDITSPDTTPMAKPSSKISDQNL
jgi:hypothetical protein